MESPYRNRIHSIRRHLKEHGAAAFVVTHLPNVFYLCGFSGSAAVLVIDPNRATLFTDARYKAQAREEVGSAQVRIVRKPLMVAAGEALQASGRCRVGFEAASLTVKRKDQLRKGAGILVRWVGWENCVEELRAVKDVEEISRMRQAAVLASEVFEEVVGLVKPGVLETDLAAEVDYRMRRKGASGAAFETIIASGPRSAWPHARPSPKPLRKNELVVFDLGAILRGYCSDMTRTVYLGRAPARIRRAYRAVLEALEVARDAVRAGAKAGAVDAAARKILKRYGLERRFVHSTGHGLGIEVHEAPRLARGEKTELRSGNVVTLEPGVYIEGTGGIRIEDDVVVLAGGAETLTRAARDFLEL
jgi:Xaa-Pro aminopeptidase